ncbi:MAG: hypothetical protein RL721_2440 [Candidatus Eisenbacteria bacterium]
MESPSGVHSTIWSYAEWNVSRVGTPPPAGIVNTSGLPSYSPVNAMRVPSGENRGMTS